MSKKIYRSEMFWVSHPNAYVSLYMKYDWLQMDRIAFLAKYILEHGEYMQEDRKQAIISVIKPIWQDMPTSEKYIVLSLISKGRHYADTVNIMLNINEHLKCDFLTIASEKTINLAKK